MIKKTKFLNRCLIYQHLIFFFFLHVNIYAQIDAQTYPPTVAFSGNCENLVCDPLPGGLIVSTNPVENIEFSPYKIQKKEELLFTINVLDEDLLGDELVVNHGSYMIKVNCVDRLTITDPNGNVTTSGDMEYILELKEPDPYDPTSYGQVRFTMSFPEAWFGTLTELRIRVFDMDSNTDCEDPMLIKKYYFEGREDYVQTLTASDPGFTYASTGHTSGVSHTFNAGQAAPPAYYGYLIHEDISIEPHPELTMDDFSVSYLNELASANFPHSNVQDVLASSGLLAATFGTFPVDDLHQIIDTYGTPEADMFLTEFILKKTNNSFTNNRILRINQTYRCVDEILLKHELTLKVDPIFQNPTYTITKL